MSGIAVEVSGLGKDFFVRTASGWGRQRLRAVEDVSFQLAKGKTLGLVGESGCGKSTLGRMLVGLVSQTRGEVLLDGRRLNPKRSASDRRGIQMVFQDPYSSLDPRMTIHDIVAEPLRIHGLYDAGRVEKLLDQVGILPDASSRLPSQFSGGQRQRIAIARALALDPRVLILDEAVSALDVSIQAQIVNLLAKLQRDLGLSYLFISHDLSVVRHIAHNVSVMYLGKIVESGLREAVFSRPAHPYTQSLLSAVPSIRRRDRKRRLVLQGELPNPVDKPTGCIFRTRCFKAEARCASEVPVAQALEDGRLVACHFASPIARDQLHTLGALSKSQLVETSREEL